MWTAFVICLVVWFVCGPVIAGPLLKSKDKTDNAGGCLFGSIALLAFFGWTGIGLFKIIAEINS